MRSFTAGERALLRSSVRRYHAKLEVRNISGTWIDTSRFLQGVTLQANRDNRVASITLTLVKKVGTESAVPLMVGSTLNRDDLDAYAPLFNSGNRFRLAVAVLAPASDPVAGDWKQLIEGKLDRPEWGPRTTMTVTGRDLGAYLLDNIIDEPRRYSSPAGQLMEVIQQQIIDDNDGNATIIIPDPPDPAWVLTEFEQLADVSVLQAAINLSDQIGWDLRYDYRGANQFSELLLRDPDREKTIADESFTPSEYKDVPAIGFDNEGVRNDIKLWFNERSLGGKLTFRRVKDAGSITNLGRQFMQLYEKAIGTSAEALRMLTAILADLSTPYVDKTVETKLWWPVQLGDLYAFPANDNHYDEEQKFAVVGYQHDLTLVNGVFTGNTSLVLRGQPSGGYRKWLEKAGPPGEDTTGLPNPTFGAIPLGEGSSLGNLTEDGRLWWEVEFDRNTKFVKIWAEEGDTVAVETPDIGSTVEESWTIYRPEGTEGDFERFATTIPVAITPEKFGRLVGAGFNEFNQMGPVAAPPPVQAVDSTAPVIIDGIIDGGSVVPRALLDGFAITVNVGDIDPTTPSFLYVERDNVVLFRVALGTTGNVDHTLLDLGINVNTPRTYRAYIWTQGQSGPPWEWAAGANPVADPAPKIVRAFPTVVGGNEVVQLDWECFDPEATEVYIYKSGNARDWANFGLSAIGAGDGSFTDADPSGKYYMIISTKDAGATLLMRSNPFWYNGPPPIPGGPSTATPILTLSSISRNGIPVLLVSWTCQNGDADAVELQTSPPGAGTWTTILTSTAVSEGSSERDWFTGADYRARAIRYVPPAVLATSATVTHTPL